MIELDCLPSDLVNSETFDSSDSAPDDPLIMAEVEAIRQALRHQGGHRGRTATALGIDKSTLWRKMKKHAIHYP